MIYIDDRIGSGELAPLFEHGLQTQVTRLQYGDAYFLGKGPNGVPVPVGIERKKIKDLVNSMTTNRLAGYQIPGLLNSYQYIYLIVEGSWRRNPDNGDLEVRNGRGWYPLKMGKRVFQVRDVIKFINTLTVNCNLTNRTFIYLTTFNDLETVNVITDLYKWWTCKDFEDHRSHLGYFRPRNSTNGPGSDLTYNPFSDLIEQTSKSLPVKRAAESIGYGLNVGSKKALEVAKRFHSIMQMCLATEADWLEIKGIGKVLAKRMYEEIHKEVKPDDEVY